MRWFERAVVDGAKRARFAEISGERRRVPSWVPSRAESERKNEPSLKPPKLPSEFVSAVRQELGQELGARLRQSLPPEVLTRRSEHPPGHHQQPQHPPAPPVQQAQVQPQPQQPAPPPAPPQVDPQLIEGFTQALLALSEARERVLSETADQLAELSALIARRVIGRELNLDPTLVRGIVREGLDALGQHQRVLVRLGAGFAVAEAALAQDLERQGETFEIHVDPMLEDYGCIVETDLGQVDESIDSRLGTLLQGVDPEPEAQ